MQKVKAIEIVIITEEKNNTEKWNQIEDKLKNLGYTLVLHENYTECCHFYYIDKDISIDNISSIIRVIEADYNIKSFEFETENDGWDTEYNPEPALIIRIAPRK